MLRRLLLYLSSAPWARRLVTNWGIARRVALRFVAGETEDQAVEAVRAINAQGMTATLDLLGESIADEAEARAVRDGYLKLMTRIYDEGLDSWVSVKLTALGLALNEDLARDNMRELAACARDCELMVAIDMEDSPYTQQTLDIVHDLHTEFGSVRGVIQSYLYRSDDDVDALAEADIGVRLVKGAYREPPEIAYPKKSEVDAAFERQMVALLDAACEGRGYPAIATHDDSLIEAGKAHANAIDLPTDRYEFQMLYGVRTALQEELAAAGYGVRIYVPFGDAWYPYFMRRLAERPANLWFFVSNFFKR